MKLMINGIWRGDVDVTTERDTQHMHSGSFRERVIACGLSKYPAESGRYHLYASYACPFSHRVLMVRALKGLQDIIGLSVLHPIWDTADGWVFENSEWSTPDGAGNGFALLHEAYSVSRPDYTGRVTVPVLWDRTSRQIVNNESLEIAQMLNGAFDSIGGKEDVDLYPLALRSRIDALNATIERSLAKEVYAIAGAHNQREYEAATGNVFGFLNELEHRLGDGRRFLFGEQLTLSDCLAFGTLVRFDAVYNPLFRATRRRIVDYPQLASFVGRVYQVPEIADTVHFDEILMHYYDGDWAIACRRGIVPDLPKVDFRAIIPPSGQCLESSQTGSPT
jgi:glutathionyl-hydroquinone reductase